MGILKSESGGEHMPPSSHMDFDWERKGAQAGAGGLPGNQPDSRGTITILTKKREIVTLREWQR